MGTGASNYGKSTEFIWDLHQVYMGNTPSYHGRYPKLLWETPQVFHSMSLCG
ncbi:hypothetical protein PDTA9759_56840 (plasmid) [Phytobacter diazotrophicus]|uniref:Uncharacterized protein n=1 Tax=Phytobacter diazotrophicus TaxID=395631 RepID=A0ABN6LXA6_9ENTR|nr:hypothetical protein PDTA9734_54810 [Phytobacter diazotrophicus]BEG84927.1 hypothetical protein PDTA9730_53830 [Phytobacter diazotrophicus]BEG91028.1 hypothetical protein PDTA9759_56840 [Phytobacter diazotrophicus]BEG96585.1 hypothetical protein PDTA9832_54440 [Phytobacter diazotrophicus]